MLRLFGAHLSSFGVTLRFPALVLAASMALGACAADPQNEPPAKVEIFSWWSSPGETDALGALLRVHEQQHPETNVINAAEALAGKARARLAERMRRGLPPDTFQANIGRDLSQWVLYDGQDDAESKVAPLNELAIAEGWFAAFPRPLIDRLSFNGQLYGVPVNIHRLNTLFYNKRVLDDLELPPPTTLPEFYTLLDQLVAAGYPHPLSIGNRFDWTMLLFLMENLFPAVVGPEFYAEYWNGEHPAEHALVRDTLDQLLRLWPYFNRDALQINWTEGVERIFGERDEQRAVLTVMGDWAKGHLMAKGFEPGRDFGAVPFPGSRGTFVFTADCFPLPKGAPHRAEALALLSSFGSREGQLAFNAFKGSIPARVDIEPKADLDALGRATWRDFQSDTLLLALSGLLDTDFSSALAVAVRDTLVDSDPDPVLFALRNNL